MQCQAITLIRKKFVTNNNCFPSPLDLNIPTTLCIFFLLLTNCVGTNKFVVRSDLTLCWYAYCIVSRGQQLTKSFPDKKTPNIGHQEVCKTNSQKHISEGQSPSASSQYMAKETLYHSVNCVNSASFTLSLFCSSSWSSHKCSNSDRKEKGPTYIKEWTWEETPPRKLQLPIFLQLPSF